MSMRTMSDRSLYASFEAGEQAPAIEVRFTVCPACAAHAISLIGAHAPAAERVFSEGRAIAGSCYKAGTGLLQYCRALAVERTEDGFSAGEVRLHLARDRKAENWIGPQGYQKGICMTKKSWHRLRPLPAKQYYRIR